MKKHHRGFYMQFDKGKVYYIMSSPLPTLDGAIANVKADEGAVSAAQSQVAQLQTAQQNLASVQAQYYQDLSILISVAQGILNTLPSPAASANPTSGPGS